MAKATKRKTSTPRKTSGRMASKGFYNPIDVHVGQRIRVRRTLLGLSQSMLGDAIGLTFQQVQKYERGANRVSSSRLFDIASTLDVPISYFYEEMSTTTSSQSPAVLMGVAEADLPEIDASDNPMTRRETIELVRAFHKIQSATARQQLSKLVKALSRVGGETD